MKRPSGRWVVGMVAAGATAVAAASVFQGPDPSLAAKPPERMLAHDVYFSLKDNSPEAKAKLVAACKKYLAGHPGTVWFAAGSLAEDFQREVNDRDFDVALCLVFKDKAAHDAYQKHERHLKFIEENKDNWKKVRVFDSYLDVTDHGQIAPAAEGHKHSEKQ